MRVVMFCHSLISDWNHGSAHFLRGVANELLSRGHEVRVFEPGDSWSFENLTRDHGLTPILEFQKTFPAILPRRYHLLTIEWEQVLDGADLVIVNEWSDELLVRKLGELRKKWGGFHLLFHDTHHRMVSDQKAIERFDLSNYDGVLAYGESISELYRKKGWGKRVWTWHEAADTRVFRPRDTGASRPPMRKEGDLVWIGNWADGERTADLQEFLIDPVRELGLRAAAHGVRYPEAALERLRDGGVEYRGWVANFKVPEVFSRFELTVHIPRRPFVKQLPGIPSIRVYEALACGIPLICAPWEDRENLFRPGRDYAVAHNGADMRKMIRTLQGDTDRVHEQVRSGWETVLKRHTCSHRVEELLGIYRELRGERAWAA